MNANTFLHVITVVNLNATKGWGVETVKYNSRIIFKLLYIYIYLIMYYIFMYLFYYSNYFSVLDNELVELSSVLGVDCCAYACDTA